AARRVALNQLRALLVTCPEPLRAELRSLTRARLLPRCRELEPERTDDPGAQEHAPGAAPARGAGRVLDSRDAGARAGTAGRGRADRAGPARRARDRTNRRRPGARLLVAQGTLPQRSRIRAFGGSAADPSLLGQNRPAPARPRRRPQAQQRLASDRDHQAQTRPAHDRLHRASPPRGQEPTPGDPLAQALPRTPPLPTARDNGDPNLTLIEASFRSKWGQVLQGRGGVRGSA